MDGRDDDDAQQTATTRDAGRAAQQPHATDAQDYDARQAPRRRRETGQQNAMTCADSVHGARV